MFIFIKEKGASAVYSVLSAIFHLNFFVLSVPVAFVSRVMGVCSDCFFFFFNYKKGFDTARSLNINSKVEGSFMTTNIATKYNLQAGRKAIASRVIIPSEACLASP